MDGQAFVHDLYEPLAYQPAGDAAMLIREVATRVGARPAQEKLALAAAGTAGSDNGSAIVLVTALSTILLVSGLRWAVLTLRRR